MSKYAVFVVWTAAVFALSAASAPTPTAHLSCRMQNFGAVERSSDGKLQDVDDWRVDCVVTRDGHQLWAGPLVVGSPGSIADATAAIDDFRKTKLLQIAKDAH